MNTLQHKKIFVTGGGGFLGKPLVERLGKSGAEVFVLSKAQCDLTQPDAVEKAFCDIRPDVVIHTAGFLGGVHFSRLYPADVFLKNLQITCNLFEAARKYQIQKLVNIGSACVYSDKLEGPFKEEEMLNLPMHPSVQYYGFSKLALYYGGKAFKEQFGLQSIHLVLANLYGPADKFDPELSHVVSSMIPKFYDAMKQNKPQVVCWGTGKTVREFLYVDDCADAVVRATELYNDTAPLNIGVGHGITMRELAERICTATGFKGEIVWDTSLPDGAGYKVVDTTKAKKVLNWEAKTSFQEGLQNTVNWFAAHYEEWLKKQTKRRGENL